MDILRAVNRVIEVDALIGTLLDAVMRTSTSADEEWLIVLTSDHGGEGTSHSAFDKNNRKIPFIVDSCLLNYDTKLSTEEFKLTYALISCSNTSKYLSTFSMNAMAASTLRLIRVVFLLAFFFSKLSGVAVLQKRPRINRR